MDFFVDIGEDEIERKKQDIVDWVGRSEKIDKFWKFELRKLIARNGKNVIIKTHEGSRTKGTLTGVSGQYVELNALVRIPLDDINTVITFDKNDNFHNTNKEKK